MCHWSDNMKIWSNQKQSNRYHEHIYMTARYHGLVQGSVDVYITRRLKLIEIYRVIGPIVLNIKVFW
jgi:hypothetical protein